MVTLTSRRGETPEAIELRDTHQVVDQHLVKDIGALTVDHRLLDP